MLFCMVLHGFTAGSLLVPIERSFQVLHLLVALILHGCRCFGQVGLDYDHHFLRRPGSHVENKFSNLCAIRGPWWHYLKAEGPVGQLIGFSGLGDPNRFVDPFFCRCGVVAGLIPSFSSLLAPEDLDVLTSLTTLCTFTSLNLSNLHGSP